MSFFEGKTVIVTGGCSGIGYATVEQLLKQNIMNVAILDLADSNNVTQSLQSSYATQNVVFIKTDVAKKDQVKKAFDEVVTKFKFVDIVVANAGILHEIDYELTINVNLLGIIHTVYTGIDFMNKDKGRGGVIVSISSTAGLDGFYLLPTYSASKHGVIGLNRCLGTDHFFNKFGIKFITVCPGFTNTPIFNDLGSRLDEGTLESTLRITASTTIQTSDSVGRCITEISTSGNNGSVWIVEEGKAREVTLKKYLLEA